MTIEELWNNLKPMITNLEAKVDNLEAKVNNLETKVDNLEAKINELETNLNNLRDTVNEIKKDIHRIGTVNMTAIMNSQTETRKELLQVEQNITQKIEQYMQQNEVEHKKFEYQIANLEWKTNA